MTVLSDNPSAYWHLNEVDPEQGAIDASGNGNDGLYIGGVARDQAGALQNDDDPAASLDGIDDYLSIADDPSLNPTSAITLEAWVNPTSGDEDPATLRPIIVKGYTSDISPYYQYGLFVKHDPIGGAPNRARFAISVRGTSYDAVKNDAWQPGSWMHLVGTYDGTVLRLYVNGVELSSHPITSGSLDTYPTPVTIGALDNLPKTHANLFEGSIDEVAVYASALSSDRVAAHYGAGSVPCTPIEGATTATYALADADAQARLQVDVTATNSEGSQTVSSEMSSRVAPPPLAEGCNFGELLLRTRPSISSISSTTIQVSDGSYDVCGGGSWFVSGYAWYRDGASLAGQARQIGVSSTQGAYNLIAVVTVCPIGGTCRRVEASNSWGSSGGGSGGVGRPALLENATDHLTFENHDGSFTIYKQCRGPHSWGDQNKTVGPGYIAKALRFNGDGTTMLILDDVRPQISSDGSNGGLGTFALQAARGTMGSVLSPSNAWRIEGRECAADSWIDPRPAQFPYATNRGVSAQQVISGPTQVTGGIDFTIDVTLRDPYAGAPPPCPSSADSVRVRYHYVIGDTQIKVWTTATRLNPNYTSSCSYNGFIKEPKLVFNIGRPDADLFHRTDYYRLYVFDTNGYLGQNQVNYKGGVGFNCFWNGKNPDPRRGSASTGQCDANKRLAARFDFGSVQEAASSGDDGGCPKFPTDTCLYIVARSVATPDSATTYNWEKACTYDAVTCPFRGFGLDGWEHKGWGDRESKQCCAPSTRQFNTVDFPDDKGNISKCVDRATLPEEWLRRWELAGGPQNQQQPGGKFDPLPYEKAAFLFKGWDGGGGSYDCEPSSWAETTSSPSWGNYFSLTFGSEYTY